MKTTVSLIGLLGVLAVLAGCGRQDASTAQAVTGGNATPPTGRGHAATDVVPGSHEDWCEEHGVPETQCTRCDPSLIPAFQAVNDWDPEHGLPMSQCTIHDPNLKIVRPPKPEAQ